MPKRKAANQRDIAVRAGVSQAAVSLVLTGRAAELGIQQATQDRILLAMDELNYVPNAAARSLRGGRNNLIGVHTFEQIFPVHANDYYRAFLTGIEEQATAVGLDLVLFASTQREDGTRTIYGKGSNRLRLADGAIILGFKKDDDELVQLANEGYPFVFIGRRDVPQVHVPYVSADYYGATREAVRLIRSRGHEHIAYLGAVARGPAIDERLAGFREEWAEHVGTAPSVAFMEPAELSESWLRAQIAAGTTMVVAEGSELTDALTAIAAVSDVLIPSDISLVSLDESRTGTSVVSHLGIPRHEMGRAAVTLLLEVIERSVASDISVSLPCTPPTLVTIKNLDEASAGPGGSPGAVTRRS